MRKQATRRSRSPLALTRFCPAGGVFRSWRAGGNYPGVVLDLSSIDLEEVGNALADQTDYEHHWLIDPDTGEIVFWTADTGIDGQTQADLDELDLVVIDPLPSWVWYQDMADFADGIADERAGRRLARAIQGEGPSAGAKMSPSGVPGLVAGLARLPRLPCQTHPCAIARRSFAHRRRFGSTFP